jgi:hypothetical protein
MKPWTRQLLPWILILSLGFNVYLGYSVWQRDAYANSITWANVMMDLAKYMHWGSSDVQGPDYKIDSNGLYFARETLDTFRSLPGYNQRVPEADWQIVNRFLMYANQSLSQAIAEQAKTGTVSPTTKQRMDRIHDALVELVICAQRRNELQAKQYTWNNGAWRAIWTDMSKALSQYEFIPLPENG